MSETKPNNKVQCADCLKWVSRKENHTCHQQIQRNLSKAAKTPLKRKPGY